ncbi:hypothetical protein BDP27DRAFT_1369428 [Rhodocollybia butyracea]|uniref:Uncharacterized protein n=1 Tax=Rhodocollybia butyracea TaxID=206335 RepID=A0A9P5U0T4_9AGAR|nr:hypothetical protein BDP27DRAFT_1369428 [Rhodocollybia butyracea]
MVYIASPCTASDSPRSGRLDSLSLPTTPTYDRSKAVSANYALDGPPRPLEATVQFPEQNSSLGTRWWMADGISKGRPLLGLDLQLESATSKSGEHDSGLLSPLESDLLALPPVPSSPCWTLESTTPILRDTELIEVYNIVPLSKAPSTLPHRTLSPLSEYPNLKTFPSPEIRNHSTLESDCRSSPESESRFRPHPTDKKYNFKYYTQQTRFTEQHPVNLPSLSLQPQFGHSESAPEFESVADSSSVVPDYFTTEVMRDDREPIVHPSRLRKFPTTGRPTQHAPSFHKGAKRPSVTLSVDHSLTKRPEKSQKIHCKRDGCKRVKRRNEWVMDEMDKKANPSSLHASHARPAQDASEYTMELTRKHNGSSNTLFVPSEKDADLY